MKSEEVCGRRMRDDSAEGSHVCGAPATHTVFTPWGVKLQHCEECASFYAVSEGFLVRPTIDICETCGAINKKRPPGVYCWCGSANDIERVNVDGLWFAVCRMHRPPPLSSLWWRLLQKIRNWFARFFRRPKQLSEIELMLRSMEKAREARSRK
jgi:hypothetical protein